MSYYVREVALQYNALDPDSLNAWWSPFLPENCEVALDVGAGTGRDARWIQHQRPDADVYVVEPNSVFDEFLGDDFHRIDDQLPDLKRLSAGATRFDVILLSAVFMHIAPNQHRRVFRKLANLLKPSGIIVITTKLNAPEASRGQFEVSPDTLPRLAVEQGLQVMASSEADDVAGRGLTWGQYVFKLPDDGSGALPLLRRVAVNDQKQSTYKLGLLRTLNRIASEMAGCACYVGKQVYIPAGLVGLYWLRIYLPLLRADVPQSKANRQAASKLGFIEDEHLSLLDMSIADLRAGARLSAQRARLLSTILRRALVNIDTMPAEHIRLEGRRIVSVHRTPSANNAFPDGMLTLANLKTFGEIAIPEHLWRAFRTFDLWLEPLLVGQWEQLSRDYLAAQHRDNFDLSVWNQAFHSNEALGRDTSLVRARVKEIGFDRCVWTDKALENTFQVDHAIPFAHWPCNQLWNLMPTTPKANRSKLDRIPSPGLMSARKHKVIDWWKAAFHEDKNWHEAFWLEAQAGLPVIQDSRDPRDLFEALCLQTSRMRSEYALPSWNGT